MYERRHHPLLPFRAFLKRVIYNLSIAFAVALSSLFLGMLGYHHFESMDWISAYENAAMILSGMGPVDTLRTEAGKVFAGSYALFSGIIFLVVMAIIIVPLFHRFLHRFLIENK